MKGEGSNRQNRCTNTAAVAQNPWILSIRELQRLLRLPHRMHFIIQAMAIVGRLCSEEKSVGSDSLEDDGSPLMSWSTC